MSRTFVAILNPVSGRRSALAGLLRIRAALRRRGADLQIRATQRAGHATELAASVDRDAAAVLVAGGDGTVCEVVNGLPDAEIPIALVGTGTENLLAREIGLSSDPELAAASLLRGDTEVLDAGSVGGRLFLSVVGIGFDAECVHRLTRTRSGHITHVDYGLPIWRTFWEHVPPEFTVVADGERIFHGRGLVIIGTHGRYGAGLRILPMADARDGALDMAVFPFHGRVRLLGHALRVLLRRHVDRGGVIHRRFCEATVTSAIEVPTEVDGDVGPSLPIECRSLPGRLRFVRPVSDGAGVARPAEGRFGQETGEGA